MKKTTRRKTLMILVLGLILLMNTRVSDVSASTQTWTFTISFISTSFEITIIGTGSEMTTNTYSYDVWLKVLSVSPNYIGDIYDIFAELSFESYSLDTVYKSTGVGVGGTMLVGVIYLDYNIAWGFWNGELSMYFDVGYSADTSTGSIKNWLWELYYVGRVYPAVGIPILETMDLINDPSPYFDWDYAGSCDGYHIQVDDSSSFNSPLISTTNWNSNYDHLSDISDGYYYWRVRAYDYYGNYGAYSSTDGFEIDNTDPTVTLFSPSSGSSDDDPTVALDWTASSDAVSYDILVDDDSGFGTPYSYSASSSAYTTGTLPDGIYYWKVRATDQAGNLGGYSSTWSFELDTTDPTVTLVSPSSGLEGSISTVYLEWTASSDSVSYNIELDDNSSFETPSTYTSDVSSYTTPSLSSGTYYWHVMATDDTGNIGPYSSTWNFIVDITSSTVNLVLPSDGYETNNQEVYLSWSSDADAVSYDILLDDEDTFDTSIISSSTSNTYYTTSTLSSGTYFWKVRAIDNVGNIGAYSISRSFDIDIDASTVILVSPNNGFVGDDSTVYLDWSSDADAVSYEIQVDDDITFVSPVISTTSSNSYYTITESDGTYFWRIRATDNVGNVGDWTSYWNFKIDTTAPSVTLISPSDGTVTPNPIVELDWNADADAVFYEIQVDDSSNFISPIIDTSSSNSYYTTTTLAEGTYFWRIRSTDGIGNVGPWTTYWSFEVNTDITGPTVTLLSPTDTSCTTDTNVYLEWTADADAVSFEIQVDDDTTFTSPIIDTTSSNSYYTVSLGNDLYFWRIRGTDNSGNVGAWTTYWSFEIDTVPPTVNLVSPADGVVIADPTVYLGWSTNDGKYFDIQVDDDPTFVSPLISTYSITDTYLSIESIPDGVYYWRIRGTDDPGNVGAWTTYWSFEIDTTGPTVTLVSPADETVTDDPTVYLDWNSDAVSYEIQVSDTVTFTSPIIDITSSNSYYTTSSLDDNTYYWRIRGTDGSGNVGEWTTYWSFEIATDTTGPVVTLVSPSEATVTDDSTVNLDWTADVDAVSYEIQVSDTVTFTSPIIDITSSNSYYTTSSLDDNTYFWRIRGTDGSGNVGEWTTYWSFEIDTTGPVVTLVAPSDGIITNDPIVDLKWNSDASSYEIQVDDDPSFGSPILSTIITDLQYTSSSLADGVYYWRIRGTDASGNVGEWATVWAFEIDTTAPSVTLSSPSDGSVINDASVYLAWTSGSGAVSFELQIDDSASFGSPMIDTSTTTPQYTFSTSFVGNYYWRVRSVDDLGNKGEWSVIWTFEVNDPTSITEPTDDPTSITEPTDDFTTDPVGNNFQLLLTLSSVFMIVTIRKKRIKTKK